MNTPKLSIIIPSFNKATYLIEMVNSISKQSFTDWELLIIDDGSTDMDFDQVHAVVSGDERIKHFRRNRLPKNGDTCRNIGMDMAKGEYVIIFDADDIVAPNCFERRVSFMDANPFCDYATFPYASFEEGSPIPSVDVTNDIGHDDSTILEDLLSSHYPFTVWANIYRRESLKNIRWDERVYIYQDFDFMVQCELKGLKHEYVNSKQSDYFYRHFSGGNSVCNSFSKEKLDSTNYLFAKVLKSISSCSNKEILLSSFLEFIILHFERLTISNYQDCYAEYREIIKRYYPNVIDKFDSIYNKRKYDNSHFCQALLHYRLFRKFSNNRNKILAIHEFGKWILRK